MKVQLIPEKFKLRSQYYFRENRKYTDHREMHGTARRQYRSRRVRYHDRRLACFVSYSVSSVMFLSNTLM